MNQYGLYSYEDLYSNEKCGLKHWIFKLDPREFTISSLLLQVADSWESLDGWLDAIRLVYTIYARGKSDVLAGIITG
jgi:hypothetical protein